MKNLVASGIFAVCAALAFSFLTRRFAYGENRSSSKNSRGKFMKKMRSQTVVFWIVCVWVFFIMMLISRLDLAYFLPMKLYFLFGEKYLHFLGFYPYLIMFFTACVFVMSAVIVRARVYYKTMQPYTEHYLIKTKKRKLLPLTSLYYATVSFFIILIGLAVVDATSDYADWLKEEDRINSGMWSLKYMAEDEIHSENLLDYFENGYPLIHMRNTPLEHKDHLRILAVGDSFVWGSGNTNVNYMWWKQLELELNKRGYACTVYGLGYGGTSTYDQLGWLKNTSVIEDVDPDIIIMGYVVNDAELPDTEKNPKGWLSFSDVTGVPITDILSGFYPNVFQTLKFKITDKFADYAVFNNEKVGYQYKNWMLQLVSEDHLRLFEQQVIEPLGTFVDAIDTPVLLLTTPEVPDKEFYRPRYEPILPLYSQAGLKVYDSLDYFCHNYSDEKYQAGYYINPVDGHPGPVSNKAYAEYMADVLEVDYPHLLGEKTEDLGFLIEINDWMPYALSTKAVAVGETKSEYEIIYPESDAERSFLFLPAKEDYVKLNFRYPVDISEVVISGDSLKSATLYVTGIGDELGYDDQTMYKLGKRDGSRCEWSDDEPLFVTSLGIHAKTDDGQAAPLSVVIVCEEGGVRP